VVEAAEAGSDVLTLRLVEPQPAVTPGQSAVLFDGDRVVGGGRIVRAGAVAVPV
jgi:tRNA-specific 2-thiouridylase